MRCIEIDWVIIVKRMVLRTLFIPAVFIASIVAAPALAETKSEAAQRYMQAFDQTAMLRDGVKQMAAQLPANQRAKFTETINKTLSGPELERITLDLLLKRFNQPELSALADFYETAEGQSIIDKMPLFMADLMPIMQQKMIQALQNAQ